MKKLVILLSLFVCACENNDNPKCLKNVQEVQIVAIAEPNPYDAPVAIAKTCTHRGDKKCTGDWVLIPKGLVTEVKVSKKITLPKHHCFVFADYYTDIDENGSLRKTPILGFAYSKTKFDKKDWNEMVETIAHQEYQDCLSHAAQDFPDNKKSDNEKVCKCVIYAIYLEDDSTSSEIPDRFEGDFRATLKTKCGNKIPAYILNPIPEK